MNSEENLNRRRAQRLTGFAAVLAAVVLVAAGAATAAPGPTDLALTKSDSPDPVVQGSTLTYTIKVENLGVGGTADATDVTVTDKLPGQVEFKPPPRSPDGTCQRAGSTVTCDLGTVNEARDGNDHDRGQGEEERHRVQHGFGGDHGRRRRDDQQRGHRGDASSARSPRRRSRRSQRARAARSRGSPGLPGNDSITGTKHDDVIVTRGRQRRRQRRRRQGPDLRQRWRGPGQRRTEETTS